MAKKNEPTDGFDEVLKHIATLSEIKNKLAYLIEKQTEWKRDQQAEWDYNEQLARDWGWPLRKSFRDKCSLEINKYKELAKLESRNNDKAKELLNRLDRRPLNREAVGPRPWGVPDAAGHMTVGERHYSEWMGDEGNATPKEADRPNQFTRKQAKGKAKKDEGELTSDQAMIFFHYFFEVARVSPDLPGAKKIDVINSVTRWSRNSISNIVYDKKGGGVFSKANGDDYVKFEADMQAVKSSYQKLGLTTVVKMIDDDIEGIGGNL